MKAKDLKPKDKIYVIYTDYQRDIVLAKIYNITSKEEILKDKGFIRLTCEMINISKGKIDSSSVEFEFEPEETGVIDEIKVPISNENICKTEYYFTSDDFGKAYLNIYNPRLIELRTEVTRIENKVNRVEEMILLSR